MKKPFFLLLAFMLTYNAYVTANEQSVSLYPPITGLDKGGEETFDLIYSTSPLKKQSSGLGLRIYFDSSVVNLDFEFNDAIDVDVDSGTPGIAGCSHYGLNEVRSDDSDSDANTSTDTYLQLAVISLESCFPYDYGKVDIRWEQSKSPLSNKIT